MDELDRALARRWRLRKSVLFVYLLVGLLLAYAFAYLQMTEYPLSATARRYRSEGVAIAFLPAAWIESKLRSQCITIEANGIDGYWEIGVPADEK